MIRVLQVAIAIGVALLMMGVSGLVHGPWSAFWILGLLGAYVIISWPSARTR